MVEDPEGHAFHAIGIAAAPAEVATGFETADKLLRGEESTPYEEQVTGKARGGDVFTHISRRRRAHVKFRPVEPDFERRGCLPRAASVHPRPQQHQD